MKHVPFDKRDDIDHEHIMNVGSVTVYFHKESDGRAIKEATKLLAAAYENRVALAA